MTIRLLNINDSKQYRYLRLLSLKTDPEAFTSTFKNESAYNHSFFINKIYSSLQKPIFGIYGVFDKKKLIATAQLGFSFYPKKSHISYIYEVYVHPDFRKRGIATRLIKHLIKQSKRDSSIEQIEIRVNSLNKSAISLYEKLGFKKVATLPHSIKERDGNYMDEFIYKIYL